MAVSRTRSSTRTATSPDPGSGRHSLDQVPVAAVRAGKSPRHKPTHITRLRGGLRPRKFEHRNGADSSGLACVLGKARVASRLLGVDAVAFSTGQFADGHLVCLGSAFGAAVTRDRRGVDARAARRAGRRTPPPGGRRPGPSDRPALPGSRLPGAARVRVAGPPLVRHDPAALPRGDRPRRAARLGHGTGDRTRADNARRHAGLDG